MLMPAFALAVFSIIAAAWLERKRLLGAEVIVLAAAIYGTNEVMSQSPSMVLPWVCFSVGATVYFSSWKDWESEVPYSWLAMR